MIKHILLLLSLTVVIMANRGGQSGGPFMIPAPVPIPFISTGSYSYGHSDGYSKGKSSGGSGGPLRIPANIIEWGMLQHY